MVQVWTAEKKIQIFFLHRFLPKQQNFFFFFCCLHLHHRSFRNVLDYTYLGSICEPSMQSKASHVAHPAAVAIGNCITDKLPPDIS